MYVIGIAGGTCSGKTTLTNRLEEALKNDFKVNAMHMDRYFKRPTPDTIAPITRIKYPEHNHPDSFKQEELFSDFDNAVAGDSDVVIMEGLLTFHFDCIREKCDLKVFVDLPSDERIVRRVIRFQRDMGQSFEEITARYLDTVRFRHNEFVEPTRWYADMVVNGTLDMNKSVDILTSYVINKIKGEK